MPRVADALAPHARKRAHGTARAHATRSDNYIGALGASVLAKAIAKNEGLRELHIKGNELGNDGACDCAACVCVCVHVHACFGGKRMC